MIRIEQVSWAEAHEPLSLIRRKVFIEEQQVPESLEWDGEDQQATQLLAYSDQIPVATLRMLKNGRLGRMAVLKEYRNQGIGHLLIERMIRLAQEQGLQQLNLSAQTHAVSFYLQFGFITEGKIYMDAGIPHQQMHRELAAN